MLNSSFKAYFRTGFNAKGMENSHTSSKMDTWYNQ
jgi:hypothetical protein